MTFKIFSRTIDEQYGLEDMCTNLIRDMNEYGVCVLDNFIGEERGLKVLQEVKTMYSAGYFRVSFKTKLFKLTEKIFFFIFPGRTVGHNKGQKV